MKVPSVYTAIFAGAVIMPVFIKVVFIIQERAASGLLLFLWSIIGFIVPIFMFVGDFRYFSKIIKREKWYYMPQISKDDYTLYFRPFWIRIGIWFISAVISISILKILGICI